MLLESFAFLHDPRWSFGCRVGSTKADAGSGPMSGAAQANGAGSGPINGSKASAPADSSSSTENSAGVTPGPKSTGGSQPTTPEKSCFIIQPEPCPVLGRRCWRNVHLLAVPLHTKVGEMAKLLRLRCGPFASLGVDLQCLRRTKRRRVFAVVGT